MFDEIRHLQRFEHERSTDKTNCIPYDKSSLAGPSIALDNLVHEYFVCSNLKDLIPGKSATKAITAEQRIKRHLRSLFWHFTLAMDIDDDCYVRISLREGSYRKSTTENPHNITRQISKVVSALEKTGFIQRRKGFLDRTAGRSEQTRIRPSLSLLEDLKTLPPDISETDVLPVSVSIRHGEPTNLDEASAQHIERMERTITQYNALLRSHEIIIPDADNGKLRYLDKNGKLRVTRTTKKTVTAIYHADQLNTLSYGRIHGGSWQNIPSVYRKTILIDGEETVELDYSAQIIHIVAGLEGIQLTGDPYALPVSNLPPEVAREAVKSAIVVMMNASSKRSLYGGIRKKLKKNKTIWKQGISTKRLVESIQQKHPFLEKYTESGKGKQLFMLDAEIARQIIQTFQDHGRIVLSIHDGFVVKKSEESFLFETMHRIWFEMFGTTIPVKIESKNT